MPGDLGIEQDNAFFVGYQEGPATPLLNQPFINNRNLMDSIPFFIRKHFPGITIGQMDRVWQLARNNGLLTKIGEPDFGKELYELTKGAIGSSRRVSQKFKENIGDNTDGRNQKKTTPG